MMNFAGPRATGQLLVSAVPAAQMFVQVRDQSSSGMYLQNTKEIACSCRTLRRRSPPRRPYPLRGICIHNKSHNLHVIFGSKLCEHAPPPPRAPSGLGSIITSAFEISVQSSSIFHHFK